MEKLLKWITWTGEKPWGNLPR